MGDVPKYPKDPDNDPDLSNKERLEANKRNEQFPEETVFSINDLANLYECFAAQDERIKNFVEKVVEFVKTQEHEPLHNFQLQELVDTEYGTARIAVLAFDTERNGKSFDLLVKDLDQDKLLPVLILNTDGQVAFDNLAGFYYT